MIVPKRIFKNWKLKKEHGDVKAIHEFTTETGKSISEVTISNALRTGRASKETMLAINNYYKKKPEIQKQKEEDLLKEIDAE